MTNWVEYSYARPFGSLLRMQLRPCIEDFVWTWGRKGPGVLRVPWLGPNLIPPRGVTHWAPIELPEGEVWKPEEGGCESTEEYAASIRKRLKQLEQEQEGLVSEARLTQALLYKVEEELAGCEKAAK